MGLHKRHFAGLCQRQHGPTGPQYFIWVGGVDYVAKFNANTGAFVGNYPIALGGAINSLAYDGTYIWAGHLDSTPLKTGMLKVSDGSLYAGPWTIAGESYGIAPTAPELAWICNKAANRVQKFDSTGTLLTSWQNGWGGLPMAVVYDGSTYLAVGSGNPGDQRAWRVKCSDGTSVEQWNSIFVQWYYRQMAADTTYVYVCMNDYGGQVRRMKLDWAAWNIIDYGRYPRFNVRDVCLGGSYFWVTFADSNTVVRFNKSDGAAAGEYALAEAGQLCYDGSHVWNVQNASHTVRCLNASDGSLVGDFGTEAQCPSPTAICQSRNVLPYT